MRENPKTLMALRQPFIVSDFLAGSPAKEAGMMIGDSLVSVNGQSTPSFTEITEALMEHKGETILTGIGQILMFLKMT